MYLAKTFISASAARVLAVRTRRKKIMVYTAVLRRNRQNRTNYRKRLAVLIGRRSFVSITISNQNVLAQVLKPLPMGDSVVVLFVV